MSVKDMRELGDAAVVPKDIKQLRACLTCHIVKTAKQFERYEYTAVTIIVIF
jgi:hypothetical protein